MTSKKTLGSIFVLEAKVAPNEWKSVDQVYGPGGTPALHVDRESAHEAKTALKSMLISGAVKARKYPIRIRQTLP